MTHEKHHHVEGILHLDEDAGSPVDDVSELAYRLDGERLRPARHIFPDTALLMPGETTRARLSFAHPEFLPRSLVPGRTLEVYRGEHRVGTLRVDALSLPALPGGAAPRFDWIEASVSGSLYLGAAAATIYLAIEGFTPCESNFEGGCGLGRGLLMLGSLLPAAAALFIGIVLKKSLARQRPQATATTLANLLWWAPLAYLLLVLYVLFLS